MTTEREQGKVVQGTGKVGQSTGSAAKHRKAQESRAKALEAWQSGKVEHRKVQKPRNV